MPLSSLLTYVLSTAPITAAMSFCVIMVVIFIRIMTIVKRKVTICQHYIQYPVFIDNNVNLKTCIRCVMLIIMDNEPKIFAAWLKKFIKDDKKITAKALAKEINCDPTTISSYIRGRTQPGYDVRVAILEVTKISHEQMMTEGKAILARPKHDEPEIEKRLSELEKRLSQKEEYPRTDITTERHRQVIERFRQKELALKINEELAELEDLDKDKLLSVLDYIQYQKKKIVEESSKKRTANGED